MLDQANAMAELNAKKKTTLTVLRQNMMMTELALQWMMSWLH